MIPRPAAVLFDFDGTLVPCLDLRAMKRRVVEYTRAATGEADPEREAMLAVELIADTAGRLDATGRDGEAYRRGAHTLIRDIELEAAARIRPYPGVRALLERLAHEGIAAGVVTRNCAAAVRRMFPDLDEYCGAVLARDDVDYLKPDPRHLEACLAQLGAAARDTVMVGDGALDMEAGRALGMHCIGVLGGHCEREALEAAGAGQVLERVTGLATLLDGARAGAA